LSVLEPAPKNDTEATLTFKTSEKVFKNTEQCNYLNTKFPQARVLHISPRSGGNFSGMFVKRTA
jgi:hypothetical protein